MLPQELVIKRRNIVLIVAPRGRLRGLTYPELVQYQGHQRRARHEPDAGRDSAELVEAAVDQPERSGLARLDAVQAYCESAGQLDHAVGELLITLVLERTRQIE